MRSSKTLTSTSKGLEVVDGFIVTWTATGLPELEARRMIRLDQEIHYRSTRETEDGRVYRLAEDFFIHQLPAYIRLKELLKAQQFHHQMMLGIVEDELDKVDQVIEIARKEDK
jgi:hypothetical protein